MKKIICSIFALCLFSNAANARMSIVSPDFKEGQIISEKNAFNDSGCKGQNLIPAITINDVPSSAKSLAITMYNPDAPSGSGWWHWVVYNIDPTTKTITPDDVKRSKTSAFGKDVRFGRNDFGYVNYAGPCPLEKTARNHYILAVYALKIEKIDIPGDSTAAMVGYHIRNNIIERASITAIYQK